MTHVLAIDLGGTKVAAALVTRDGVVVRGSTARRPTGRAATREGVSAAIRDVATSALSQLPADAVLSGVGVGSAGPIDHATGAVFPVNMPDARGLVPAAALELGVTTRLALDGTCIALAEHRFGALRGCRSAVAMIVSTGIGGGAIVDGRPVTGASGNAGHIGQVSVCTADGGSTVETVAAGPGSVAWARARGWTGATGEELATSYRAGDPTAVAAVMRSADAVGQAIADMATLLDLEAVAIDGGFSRVADDYVDLVGRAVALHAQHDYVRAVRVVRSDLGGDGPLLGAAALVLD